MAKYRSIFLLVLAAVCGIASPLLITFVDGFYGVAVFMAFPFLVMLFFASMVYDTMNEGALKSKQREIPRSAEPVRAPFRPNGHHPRAV